MEITVSQEQARVPVTVVALSGNLDSASAPAVQKRVEELIAGGAPDILLDLRAVPYMSSAGLRALTQIYNHLRGGEDLHAVSAGVSAGTYHSPHLKLLGPRPRVMDTLRMSGFDMFLDIHAHLKDALAAF